MKLHGRLRLIAVINAVFILLLAIGMTATGCIMARTTSSAVAVKQAVPLRDIESITRSDSKDSGSSSITVNDISIILSVGTKGLAKSGEWLPVHVIVENSGKSVKGHVAVEPGLTERPGWVYRQSIDLEHGARKQLLFNIHSNYLGNVPIKAALISNGKVLAETGVRFSTLAPNEQIILALIDDDSNRQFFKDITAEHPDINIKYMEPRDLPFRDNSLSQISTIVISGVSTGSLTKEQKSALLNWLASGGRLFVCGGPSWKKAISGLSEEILPVEPSATKIVSNLSALENFAGVASSVYGRIMATSIPIATVSSIHGKIIAGDTNNPMIVSRSFGSGEVNWIALDLTLEPFVSWRSNAPFWDRLNKVQQEQLQAPQLRPEARKMDLMPRFESLEGLRSSISSIPALKLPKLNWLIPYIVLYIIIIGPINYLILKRKDKKELAWITVPAIILVFALGTFTYAYAKKGGSILINQANIVEHFPGTKISKITNAFGVFSPSKRTYDVHLPRGSSVTELTLPGPVIPERQIGTVFTVEDGLRPKIKDMGVGMWSMRGAYTERFVKITPSLGGTIKFTKSGAAVNLYNTGKEEFTDAIVIANNHIWKVGKLPASKEYKANLGFSNEIKFDPAMNPIGHQIYEPHTSFDARTGKEDGRQTFVMTEIVNYMFGYQGERIPKSPIILAWLNRPVETIVMPGEKPRVSGLTAIISPLTTELEENMDR